MLSFFHEVGILNHVLGEKNLLIGLFVHEVETVFLGIEELIGTAFHFDSLDLGACGEGVLQDAAVLEIAEFGFHESGTLAGLDVLEPNNHTRFVVEFQVKTILKICCCCHINII